MVTPQPQYSPKQVAQALRASESSVKRWCDQGAIPTIRTVGGHRRITLDGLQHFLSTSERTLESPQFLGLPKLNPRRRSSIPGGVDASQHAFRKALSEGDELECQRILQSRISSGSSRSEAADFLITDAMHGIGEAWEQKSLDPYQERRACDICIRLINRLRSELNPIPSSAPVAIGGAPEGDPYQLPTTLVELSLREVGWNAISIGSNLPLESFWQAAHDHDAQLVWLSVSTISNLAVFVAELHRLLAGLGDEVSLVVGGRALTDQIRPQLSYTAHCDSLRNMVELASMMRLNAEARA